MNAWLKMSFGLAIGLAAAGCQKEQQASSPGGSNPPKVSAAAPATSPAAPATTPTVLDSGSGLFTLPPSKGPAPHKFKQISLSRSGPHGDFEMELTGDGIYRIRDHANGRSYAGDGKLTDEQISAWADAMKDWDSLKESYVSTPPPTDVDIIEIMYGGKKVVCASAASDNPKQFTSAYQRLLDLVEQSRKESGVAADAPKSEAPKEAPASSTPASSTPAPSTPAPSTPAPKDDAKEATPNKPGVTPTAEPAADAPKKDAPAEKKD